MTLKAAANNGYRCILFDLDETLCYFATTKSDTKKRVEAVLQSNDINFDEFWQAYSKKESTLVDCFFHNTISEDEFRIRGSFRILESMTPHADAISKQLSELFLNSLNSVKLFDDVIAFLIYLKNFDIKIALVTNGPHIAQRNKILSTNLDGYFDYSYISGQIGFAKPDIRFFAFALNDLKVKAQHTIMIGNSVKDDFLGAIGAGIDFVLLDRFNVNADFGGARVTNLAEFKVLLFD